MRERHARTEQAAEALHSAEILGHFGELLQGVLDGEVVLVTLPCPALVTRVSWAPGPAPLRTVPADAVKARAAAALAAKATGLAPIGGCLTIERPVPAGRGAGSSTAESLGAIRVVAAAAGLGLTATEEARLCLAAEGAVDPLMEQSTVLYASRGARVLRRLPPLPPMTVVGGFAGPGSGTDPKDSAFADAAPLLAPLEDALRLGDLAALGRIARTSANARQGARPLPHFEEVATLADGTTAHGPVIAHTGSAMGLLLPPRADPRPMLEQLREIGLTDLLSWELGQA